MIRFKNPSFYQHIFSKKLLMQCLLLPFTLLVISFMSNSRVAMAGEKLSTSSPRTDSSRSGNMNPGASKPESVTESLAELQKTIDETHDTIEKNILEQAIRLDNFFGHPNSDSLKKTQYQLRWRNSLRAEEGENLKYGSSIRANLVLSKINERLRLSVYGDNEVEKSSESLPEDPGNPGFDKTFVQKSRLVNTELRYQLFQTPVMDLFMGAGVRVTLPMEAFVRSRFSYLHKLSNLTLFRFSETVFFNDFDDLGETTEFSMDRQLDRKTILRWANSGTLSQEIDGLEWGSELSLIRELSEKSAMTFTGGIHGNTHISSKVGNYQVLARYRRNFLRRWLYYELEPAISWPRDDFGNYSSSLSFIFRLEVLFEGPDADGGWKFRF